MAKVNKRAGKPRGKVLAKGIRSLSHAQVVKKGARYKWFGKGGPKKAAVAAPAGKPSRYYPADDVPVPRKSGRTTQKPTKLKSSIVPGTVLILLSGRFRGKRVVFLKQLASGTLLVSGPYVVNGVPLRRVNQTYVIATSVVVDISKVKIPDSLNDSYFKKPESAGGAGSILATEKKATETSEERKKDQKAVDDQLVAAIKKVDQLEGYIKSRFSLKKGDRPHELKF